MNAHAEYTEILDETSQCLRVDLTIEKSAAKIKPERCAVQHRN